ncbi:MAG: hypothetical protein K6A63_00100 [Acholeplasmatales bacterium]|nr:hypothetical protein [Acholeplasmatales bacterium]
MPKKKIKDLLKELNEAKKIKYQKADYMIDVQNNIIALGKMRYITKNLIWDIQKNYGDSKLRNIAVDAFNRKSLNDKSFNANEKLKQLDDSVIKKRVNTILEEINKPNSNIPSKDAARIIFKTSNIKNLNDIEKYGYNKLYEKIKEKLPAVFEYAKEAHPIAESAVLDYFVDDIADVIADEKSGIDLEAEIEYDAFVLDDVDPAEFKTNKYAELFDEIKKSDFVKGKNLDNDLAEIKLMVEDEKPGIAGDLNVLRETLENQTNNRRHERFDQPINNSNDRYYNREILNIYGNKFPYLIPKDGAGQEYDEKIEFKYNENAKAGLKAGFEKLKAMNVKQLGGEETIKDYAFKGLRESIIELRNITFSIERIIKDIKQKEAEINLEADQAKKAALEALKAKLVEEENKELTKLMEQKAKYNQEMKNLRELAAICKKYFPKTVDTTTNIDVTRNGALPYEFRVDPYLTGQMNGLVYAYNLMQNSGKSMDEFIDHPAKCIRETITKSMGPHQYKIDEKNDTRYEKYRKVVNCCSLAKDYKEKNDAFGANFRGLEFLQSIDNENAVNNHIVVESTKNFCQFANDYGTKFVNFAENGVETFSRIFIVNDDVPIESLIADNHIDPITRKVVEPATFHDYEYINSHELEPSEMLGRFAIMISAICDKNQIAKLYQSVEDETISQELIPAVKGFAMAATKYIQAYGIDPNSPDLTNDERLLVKSIREPEEFVKEVGGFHQFRGDIDTREYQLVLDSFNVNNLDLKEAKTTVKTLETAALNEERNFDALYARKRQEADRRIDALLSNNPTPKDYDAAAEIEREVRNFAIKHCNYLQKNMDTKIPESFYTRRVEQIMAGEPLGKLTFFNTKYDEKTYGKDLAAKLNNNEKTFTIRCARDNNRHYPGITVRNSHTNYLPMKEHNTKLDEDKAFDKDNIIDMELPIDARERAELLNAAHVEDPNLIFEINNQIMDIGINDDENIINTSSKQNIKVDLGENIINDKSKFIDNDDAPKKDNIIKK